VGWLIRQMPKCGVEVHLGSEVTPELIERVAPGALMIACGAEFNRTGFSGVVPDPIPRGDRPHVLTPEQVLRGEKQPGQRVVIADEDYREVAPGLAEPLARQGKQVTIVTSQTSVAKELLFSLALLHVLARLAESGVEIITSHYIKRIDAGSVQLFNDRATSLHCQMKYYVRSLAGRAIDQRNYGAGQTPTGRRPQDWNELHFYCPYTIICRLLTIVPSSVTRAFDGGEAAHV